MEACTSVDREVSSILDKFKNYIDHNTDKVNTYKAQLQKLQVEIGQGPPTEEQALLISKYVQSIRDCTNKFGTDHRELHSSVSKVGKAIDRNFVTDYDSVSRGDVFSSPEQQRMLNEVILQHFYRQGQLEISDVLADEAGLTPDVRLSKEPFQELNSILEALKARNLEPALEWAVKHREELMDKGTTSIVRNQVNGVPSVSSKSSLEMKLHKLQFIELLRKETTQMAAVEYARYYLMPFVGTHEREIQALLCAVMYAGPKLATSPYAGFLDQSLWHEISDLFVKDACALMGLSVESPLSVVVNAGCKALPALLNIKQVMHQRQVSGVWSVKDELPIEIDLGPNCRYHSIFACPILRQQTTEENPPLRLTCGHCISKDALSKLSNGHKLKCPYCPVEQNPGDARRITF